MSITGLKFNLANIVKQLNEGRQESALIFASDMIANVNDRLLNKGENSEGVKFPLYSETQLGEFISTANIYNSNKPSAIKKRKKDTSYKATRILAGLPVDKRTHSFTGAMLQSIRPVVVENNTERTIVEIKSSNPELQKILNYNSNRMKTNLMEPSKEEIELITDANQERLNRIIQTNA